MTTSNNAANRAGEAGALWGGRFASGPSPELQKLSKSTLFDWALADYDITGSQAHAKALHAAGYLTTDELKVMTDSLEKLRAAVASGEFVALESDEDVHSALERGLIDIAGVEVGGKLRAGRAGGRCEGARAVRRTVQEVVENPLSERILSNAFEAGDVVTVATKNNKIVLEK